MKNLRSNWDFSKIYLGFTKPPVRLYPDLIDLSTLISFLDIIYEFEPNEFINIFHIYIRIH